MSYFIPLFKVLYVLNESIVQRLKDLSKYFPHDYWLGKWNKSQKEGTRYNTHFQWEVTKSNNIIGKWMVFFLHWNMLLNIMLNIKLTELGRQPLLGKILSWTFPRYHDSNMRNQCDNYTVLHKCDQRKGEGRLHFYK